MAKVRVPLYGVGQQRVATVDTEATPGAVVGVNLLNPDGSLFVPDTSADAPPGAGIALDDVQALADAPITVTGSPAEGAFKYGWVGTTSDVPEGSRLYYTDDRVRAVLGRTIVGFSFGDAPHAIYVVPDDRLAFLVRLVIDTPFDGAGSAIAVGTAADAGALMPTNANDPTVATSYEFASNTELALGDSVQLTITPGSGATQGAGRIILDAYQR